MKLAILTCTTKNRKWLYEITNKTKQKYCEKFNIDFIFTDDFNADKTMFLGWNKIAYTLKYLPNYDYVMWMDDDAGFINFTISLEDFIKDKMKNFSFCICKDLNDFNSGVYIVKNDTFGNYMFNTLWENRHIYKKKVSKHFGYMDQPAICDMCDIFTNNVYIGDGKFLNSYDKRFLISEINQRNDKSLILHIANGQPWKESHKKEIINAFNEVL